MTELIPQEIHETPTAIRATVAETRAAAREAALQIRERQPKRVFLVGNGTSLYSSMAAAYTGRALAQPGDPFVLAVPAGDFRYYMPALEASDVVVGVSASGEFRDVLAVFEQLEGRNLRVGISHIPGSSITKLADTLLFSAGGPSKVPVMTKTYASTLTAAHLLMLELFQAGDEWYQDLADSAGRAEQALAAAGPVIDQQAPEIAKFEHAFYFGAGPGYAAALEGSLKMKEMALLHAEGSETWEMASGPATVVNSQYLIVPLYTGSSASDAQTAEGALHAKEWGARVLEAGPTARAGDLHFAVPSPRFEPFASLSLLPPLALLAYRVATLRGNTPDHPQWRERYLSQGMSHILGE